MNRLWNIRHMEPFHGPSKWVPTLGELQKTLQKGEYLPLRPLPMFESNFVQVTNRGAPVYVHHRTNRVTMGVAASQPGLLLPDILLIAQPPEGREGRECSSLVLTRCLPPPHLLPTPSHFLLQHLSPASPRMLPLHLLRLYVHDLSSWRLKLRLVTGRYYYLELDAAGDEAGFLFDRWLRLIHLLQEPATTWVPRTLHAPATDLAGAAPPASTWRLQVGRTLTASPPSSAVMIVEPNFPYKTLTRHKQRKARALKRKFKSQAVGDSVPLIWSQLEHADPRQKSADKKSQRNLHPDASQTQVQVTGKPSITIRTIFSIVSNTVNHTQSPSKAAISGRPHSWGSSSDSDTATVLGGLIETPIRCASADTPDTSLLEPYDPFDTYLWQDIENLMDPDTSTLSSPSLPPATYPPPFSLPAAYSFFRRRKEKAQPRGPEQRQRPPASQKTANARVASWKVPFLFDQSKRVSAVHTPSQKISTVPGRSRRAPVVPAVTQKTPTVHDSPRKAPAVSATSRKSAATSPGPSRKAPPLLALLPKSVSASVPRRKSLFPPTPSQKDLTSPTQYQMAPDTANLGTLPMGSLRGQVLERSKFEGMAKPLMFVGTQEMDVIETRTQKTSQELPFRTTKKESEEVMITKALDVTLDGLKGRGKLKDKVHRKKEEISVDKPGLTSQTVGQQQKWLKTQELVIQGPPEEQRRPFSVEELTLAKMMIMAKSKEPPPMPATVSLPSWLLTRQVPDMSTASPSQVPLRQRTPEVIGEPFLFGTWVKETMRPWAEESMYRWVEAQTHVPKEASKVPDLPRHEASSLITDDVSPNPIPLPASRWEEVPPSPVSLTPISKMGASVFQKPKRPSHELEGWSDQLEGSPLAMTELSSDVILPMLLEDENMMDMAPEVENIEELDVYSPSARYL
ncbi:F71E2 protein, partial [Crocuta crocuta]